MLALRVCTLRYWIWVAGAVEFYARANEELYDLLASTRARAPPEQPDFEHFQQPFERR